MGEHGTWFDYLYKFDWWRDLSHDLQQALGRETQVPLAGLGPSHWTLTHVLVALLAVSFVVYGAFKFRMSVGGGQAGLVPPPRLDLRHLFELLCDATLSLMIGVMGEKNAKRFFPLIGSLAMFILFNNVAALIPGFAPGTDTLKTNLALAGIVFLLTHYYGFQEHGVSYVKQFVGPIWWLAPLMLPIELIGHLARPVSLSLRLMGNMVADHKVIFMFFTLVPWFVPIPFYFLGMLVCVVQTLVFCLLSMVYISMAISHDH